MLELDKINNGIEILKSAKVVFACLVRDCESTVGHIINTFKTIQSYCPNSVILFIENDSKDNTVGIIDSGLGEGSYGLKSYNIIHLDINKPRFNNDVSLERAEFMAGLRNVYLDEIKKQYADYDYLVVLDGDMKFIDIGGLISSFACDRLDWGNIGCNGTWKTNTPEGWVYYDTWSMVAKNTLIYGGRHIKPFPANFDYYELDACFGGCCLYKLKPIIEHDLSYSVATAKGRLCSEHVSLNIGLRNHGFRSYLNSNWLVIRA